MVDSFSHVSKRVVKTWGRVDIKRAVFFVASHLRRPDGADAEPHVIPDLVILRRAQRLLLRERELVSQRVWIFRQVLRVRDQDPAAVPRGVVRAVERDAVFGDSKRALGALVGPEGRSIQSDGGVVFKGVSWS